MKQLAGFAVILLIGCSSQPTTVRPAYVGKLWMVTRGPWERPPAELGLDERLAHATLLRFDADHRFSMMGCLVIDQRHGMCCSVGDGLAVFLGSWSEQDGIIDVRFRVVDETVQPVGGRIYPGPEERAPAFASGRSVRFNGEDYRPAGTLTEFASELAMRDYDSFIEGARATFPDLKPPQ